MPLTHDDATSLMQALDAGELSPEDEQRAYAALDEYATSVEKSYVPGYKVTPEEFVAGVHRGDSEAHRNELAALAQIPMSLGAAVTGGLEAVGALPAGKYDQYQQARRDISKRILGDAPKNESLQTAVQTAATLPLGAEGKLGTIGGAIRTAAGNALIGAATSIDENAKASQATSSGALALLVGTSIPTVASAVPWVAKAIPRRWVAKLQEAFSEDQMRAVDELTQQFTSVDPHGNPTGLSESLGDWLTYGQRTGNQGMLQTEAKIAGDYASNAYKKQADILREGLLQYGDRYGRAWQETLKEVGDPRTEDVAGRISAALRGQNGPINDMNGLAQLSGERAQGVIRQARSDLADIRRREFNSMLDSADAAVTAEKIRSKGVVGAAQIPLAMPSFQEGLVSLMAQHGVTKQQLGPAASAMLNELGAFKGHVSLETFMKTLRGMTEGNGPIVHGLANADAERSFGNAFKSLMFDTVDDLTKDLDFSKRIDTSQLGPEARALFFIKAARRSYAERSAQFDALGASRVAAALGLDVAHLTPETALVQFAKAGRSEQIMLRQILNQHDPALLGEVKSMVWRDAIRSAEHQAGGMTKATFDPLQAADNLMQLVGTKDDQFAGLFSPAESMQIRKAISNIRAIDVRLRGTGQAADPEKVAMSFANWGTVASRPFIIQQVYRFITRENLDKMLFTPEGRKALEGATGAPSFPKLAQYLAHLTSLGANAAQSKPSGGGR